MEKSIKEIFGEYLEIIIRVLQMIKNNELDIKDLLFFIEELSDQERKRMRQRRKTITEILNQIKVELKGLTKSFHIDSLKSNFEYEDLNRELNNDDEHNFSRLTEKKMSLREIFSENKKNHVYTAIPVIQALEIVLEKIDCFRKNSQAKSVLIFLSSKNSDDSDVPYCLYFSISNIEAEVYIFRVSSQVELPQYTAVLQLPKKNTLKKDT